MAQALRNRFIFFAAIAGLSLAGLCLNVRSQEDPSRQAHTLPVAVNRLISAKLIAVTPMPDDLDKWIIENLRAWGKYRVTGDPEGVDLVMSASSEDKSPEYKTKRGVVRPKKEKKHPPVLAVTVEDWASKGTLWQAELLNEKPGAAESDSSAGPDIILAARGLSTEQLGAQLARKFREYVSGLEKTETGKQ